MSFYRFNGSVVHVLEGGPTLKIQSEGVIYEFEMHPYCGPVRLNKKGDPHRSQPNAFLQAASYWAQQGKRIEGELCRWDHPPEDIIKHIGGRNYEVIGKTEARRGE